MTAGRLGPTGLLAWLAIALTVPYLLLLGGTLTLLASPEGRIIEQAIMLGAGLAGIAAAVRHPELLRSPVVVAGALFVAAGIASAVVSQRPAASLEATALLVLSAPCYLAIRAVAWDERLRSRIRWLIVVSAFLVLLPYVVEVLAAWVAWWSAVGPTLPPIRPGNAAGTVGNSNALATYTYLLAPIAAWAATSSRRGRLVATLLIACAVFALVTTGSRGAWLGAIAGLGAGGALVMADRGRAVLADHRTRLVLVAAIGLVVVVAVGPWILERFATGDAGRLELWSAALSIFARYPLLGGGPGSWQGLRQLEPITDPNTASLVGPHDSILYVAAETGIAGLVASGILVVAIALVARRAYVTRRSADRGEVAVAVGSLVALVVHSTVDPQFHLAAVVLTSAYLVARLEGPAGSMAAGDRRRAPWPAVAMAAASVIAALILARVDAAMLDGRAGVAALDRGDWPGSLAALDRAVAVHDLGIYELGRSVALSRLGRDDEAVQALSRVRDTDPFSFADAQIAVLARADPAAAERAARAVLAAGPYDPTATLNAAAILTSTDPAAARSMIADVVRATPFLDLDPLPVGPVSTPTWTAAIAEAIAAAALDDPLGAASIAAEAGNLRQAGTLAAAAPEGPERTLFEAYAAALVGDPADLAAARAAVLAGPTPRGVTWYARLAVLAGSEPDRRRAALMMGLLYSGSPFGAAIVDLDDDPARAAVARVLYYPDAFSYRQGPKRPYVAGMATITYAEWRP